MDRLYKIAVLILEYKDPITTEMIANQLGVSVKTVRNDLKKLEDIVGKEGLCLVKKTGTGNFINGPEDNKQLFLRQLKKELKYVEPFSAEGRQRHILKRLFMDSDEITAGKLADEMYVSTSTVYKDLRSVEEVLDPYHLSIVKKGNHILELKGDEKQYRNAISNLIFQSKSGDKDGPKSDGYQVQKDSRIDKATREQLEVLMSLDYLMLETHIVDLEKQLGFQFSQEAFISLVIHIAIAIKRIRSGKDIVLTGETLQKLVGTKEYQMAKQASKKIGKSFGIVIPNQEIGYITLHILGSKIGGEEIGKIKDNLHQVKEMELAAEIANKMMDIASDALHINLTDDPILFQGLVLHLRPTINRLRYGLTLRNPILEEIKTNYPDIFGVAWMAGKELQKYFDIAVPESEIGYIALHIGASLERNREKIKTLVVCHSGIGTSQLLSARLKRSFKELDIIGITSSITLKEEDIQKTDIIISTVPLHNKVSKPVFTISPLFTSEDVRKVEWMIGKYQNKSEEKDRIPISKEVFIRSKAFYSKEDVISGICQSLLRRDYLYTTYEKSVLEREKIYSTEVGNGIALPHGNPSEVKKSCVSVTVLKHPMKWDSETVEFVFLVSLKTEDIRFAKTIFTNLSDLMDEEIFAEALRSGQKEAMSILDRLLTPHG